MGYDNHINQVSSLNNMRQGYLKIFNRIFLISNFYNLNLSDKLKFKIIYNIIYNFISSNYF